MSALRHSFRLCSRRAGILPAIPALLATLLASAVAAQPFQLALPLDCTPGQSCFVQNYPDDDPGPGARDFSCGALTYDGHKGTDFALPSLADMAAGVEVRAAAAGRVTGLRDGMIDRAWTSEEAARIDGRDCGNGVVIDHGDGWETQYCHMRQGSLRVAEGQQVQAGTPLGLVGLSGKSQFPHLHLSVRHNDAVIDPFAPEGTQAGCGTLGPMLWAAPLPYVASGFIAAGFTTRLPEYEEIQQGTAAQAALPRDLPFLVLWAHAFGLRAGDEMELAITGPGGSFTRQKVSIDRTQARAFRATGKRLQAPLAPGLYSGRATLIRDGAPVARTTVTVMIRP